MTARPRAIVLRAAGTNCDRESVHALELAGAEASTVHVGRLAERPELLDGAAILLLPGGFTYGDDVGAGRILALELEVRLGDRLRAFVDEGRIVIGICNGFQVLVRLGFLPAAGGHRRPGQASLTDNDSGRFECRWIAVESRSSVSVFCPPGRRLELPIAHGEGRLVVADEEVRSALAGGSQVAFAYVDGNPNGSVDDIAGLVDPTGRVLGMMPHPERFVHPYQHPAWTRRGDDAAADGRVVFEGAVAFAREVLA